jgi:hypothetical protein
MNIRPLTRVHFSGANILPPPTCSVRASNKGMVVCAVHLNGNISNLLIK